MFLNLRPKSIKFLKYQHKFYDHQLDNIFSYTPPKAEETEEKKINLTLVSQQFLCFKGSYQKVKLEPIEWDEIFANGTTGHLKGQFILKQVRNSSITKTLITQLKMGKRVRQRFPQRRHKHGQQVSEKMLNMANHQ